MIHHNEFGGGGAPYVRRTWRYVELQFRGEVIQTRMLRWYPHWLQVGYTRTMLAALLLVPQPARIGIIGFGGGAQAKFCHRYLLGSSIEAVENDANVLALRDEFRVPEDDERLSVELGDGARWLQSRRARYGVLLLDAYDVGGIPPALSTQAFYRRCADALEPGGVMASNLYATNADLHLKRLRRAFDGNVCVLEEPGMENKVVFAWRGQLPVIDADAVLAGLPWPARRQLASPLRRLQLRLRRLDETQG